MRQLVVALVVACTFLIIVNLLGATSTLGHAANNHGCAPNTPSPTIGSPTLAPALSGEVLINELLTIPQSPWRCADPNSTFSTIMAWIELYNPQNQPLDLFAARASFDTGPNTTRYWLPFGTTIAAHGFQVFFPDTASVFFKNTTTQVRLTFSDTLIDEVNVPLLAGDQSYARTQDGADNWQITNQPTIDASNQPLITQKNPTPTATAKTKQPRTRSKPTLAPASNTNVTLVDGQQPSWSKLHLPVSTLSTTNNPPQDTPPDTKPTQAVITTHPSETGLTPPLEVSIFGLASLGLLGTLYWCWRLFKRK